MKYWLLALVAVVAVGIAMVGCTKPADDAGAPVVSAPKVPAPGPAEPTEEPAEDAGETLVLTDPNGEEMALTTAGADEAIATDAGLPLYPGAKAYTVDLLAMGQDKILPPDVGEAGPELMDLMVQAAAKSTVMFATEDSFEDVLAWAKENMAGWTISEPEEKDGMTSAEATSPDHEGVEVVIGDTGEHRLVMVNDADRAADLNAQLQELMMKVMSEQMEAAAAAGTGAADGAAPADAPAETAEPSEEATTE